MRKLIAYFLRGLVVTAPVAVTLWVCWALFQRVDGLLHLSIPGAGFVVTVVAITLVGVIASSLVSAGIVSVVESSIEKLPFVRLVYSSTRDLLNAFVGEKRRFDIPVTVTIAPGSGVKVIGFVTRESLDSFGIPGYVAVYVPQAYAFAGHLLLVPAMQVEPLAGESADLMAFVVSGGVADGARREPRNLRG
ncbi:MAG: DUF502 domain-containing protein [Gemmatimonadota bacterium]|nr:DUF502 domain-containing protein [Gemmatimonadota bacterium]